MPNRDAFPAVFAQLKGFLAPFAPHVTVETDATDSYALLAPASERYPKGLHVGVVQIKKAYVSYHLMPVYVFPDLLLGLSEPLRKRMQGKSCFNFTTPLDQTSAEELARLTAAGVERYRQEGVVSAPLPPRAESTA